MGVLGCCGRGALLSLVKFPLVSCETARVGLCDCPPSFRFCVVCCGPGESQVTVAEVGTVKELRPQESPVKEVLCWGADLVG